MREESVKLVGTVKWFNPTKGYGFIAPEVSTGAGDKADVFVHISAVQAAGLRELREGQRVVYVLESSDNGKKSSAVNLEIVN